MNQHYDLAILGGGPGGYVAAIRASQLGLKVAVIEEDQMGGTCLNWGCIPTKSLLHSAEVYQSAKNGAAFGITTGAVGFDYTRIAARKDQVVSQLRRGVAQLVQSNGGTIIHGRGVILNPKTITVEGPDQQTVTTEKMIIATGSVPFLPPIPGIDGARVLDSNQVLALTECPSKITIIGGGVIGVEFASLFQALDRDVTIIEMMDEILPGIDLEIAQTLRKTLEKKGVRIFTKARVTGITSADQATCQFEQNNQVQTAKSDVVIVAIGRKPRSQNIGLENIGIETLKGMIPVNDQMETPVAGVYAIGDVTGKIMLAHVASEQGIVAAENAAGGHHQMKYSIVPSCIYTNPEIAVIGLSEADATRSGIFVKVGRFPVAASGKAMIAGEKDGFIKMISDVRTGEVLGAQIIGPKATELISGIGVAMTLESTTDEIAKTIHPHPTLSEMIMEAAMDISDNSIHQSRKPKK